MEKTVMMKLIDALEGNKNAFPATTECSGIRAGFSNAIQVAQSLLELEKKQIVDAFNQDLYGNELKFQDGEQYYTNTYKK